MDKTNDQKEPENRVDELWNELQRVKSANRYLNDKNDQLESSLNDIIKINHILETEKVDLNKKEALTLEILAIENEQKNKMAEEMYKITKITTKVTKLVIIKIRLLLLLLLVITIFMIIIKSRNLVEFGTVIESNYVMPLFENKQFVNQLLPLDGFLPIILLKIYLKVLKI